MILLTVCEHMNKKLITSYLTAGVFFSFVFVSSAGAFWPFDALFKKQGDVKAVTNEKLYAGGDVQGSSKAYMTYQTLVSMNEACRKTFSREYPTPTKAKVTPSQKGKAESRTTNTWSTESTNKAYEMEFGIDKKSETELNSIYNNLKARCDNIASLVARMQKIYKGNARPSVSMTPSPVKEDGSDSTELKASPTRRPIINFKIREESEEKN